MNCVVSLGSEASELTLSVTQSLTFSRSVNVKDENDEISGEATQY